MILAHDIGTTGNKASLHDDSGRIVAATTAPAAAAAADMSRMASSSRIQMTGGTRSAGRRGPFSSRPG